MIPAMSTEYNAREIQDRIGQLRAQRIHLHPIPRVQARSVRTPEMLIGLAFRTHESSVFAELRWKYGTPSEKPEALTAW